MRILLSNDDGFYAPGLQTLYRALCVEHDVTIVAPDREKSASSHAITVQKPLYAKPVRPSGWRVSGTPADCIKLAVETLLPIPPDLVLSGINHGSNLGRDIFYSGTVSAAMEAVFLGIPALALSAAGHSPTELHWIAQFVRWFIARTDAMPPVGRLLNINFPTMDEERGMPSAIAWVRLGRRDYHNEFELRNDARGRPYYWLVGHPMDELGDETTDVHALASGSVTITPISPDLTDHAALPGQASRRELIPPTFGNGAKGT